MHLIGHRGARGEAPENTLSGFRHLIKLGIRRVELDIQVSADGNLVVIHDTDVARTTNGQGRVDTLTTAELSQLDACHTAFPTWPDREGVPTLEQVMEVISDFDHIQFEVKAKTQADTERVAEVFPGLWRKYGFGARAYTTSFNPLYLAQILKTAPEIPRGLLIEEGFSGDWKALALMLQCRSIGPHQRLCTQPFIELAHSAGLEVSTWTVNEADRMRELRAWGVDSLITDLPSLAISVLAEPE